LTGGIVSGAGIGAQKIIGTVTTTGGRIVLQTTTGAIVSGATGALGCLLNNVVVYKKIDKAQFIGYLVKCGATHTEATDIWLDLEEWGYIQDFKFTL
jgi:hypothetical protein